MSRELPEGFCWYSESEKEEIGAYCEILDNRREIAKLEKIINKIEGEKIFAEGLKEVKMKKYKIAIELYEKAAELGCYDAMNNLGEFYLRGIGIEKNFNKAFELFLDAAKNGSVAAMRNLGHCYKDGIGTNIDLDKYSEWNIKAFNLDPDVNKFFDSVS